MQPKQPSPPKHRVPKVPSKHQGDFTLVKGNADLKLNQFVDHFNRIKQSSDFMKFVQ